MRPQSAGASHRPPRTVDCRAGDLGCSGRRRLCGRAGHGRPRCAQPRVLRAGPDPAHRDRQSHRGGHNRSSSRRQHGDEGERPMASRRHRTYRKRHRGWHRQSQDPLKIWVDRNGNRVGSPTPTSRAAVDAVGVAYAAWQTVALAVVGLICWGRSRLERRRDSAWERDIRCLIHDDSGRKP